jgi:hypothetical protein
MRRLLPLLLILVTASVSCSGAEKSKASDTDEAVEKTVEAPVEKAEPRETPPDQGEGIPWDAKTDKQKKAYMKLTVKPKMEALFTEFDGERFGEFRCTTCHGPNPKERNFEMPNPDLPSLADWEKLEADKPEAMEFMKTKVEPQMANLLGMQPYDPETKTGFGCSGCHPH